MKRTLIFLVAAAVSAAFAQSSATLEKEAEKTLKIGGREAAVPLFLRAAETREREAKKLYAKKEKDELSLDAEVAIGEDAEIMAGAADAVAARDRDAEALHCLATAVDFDYAGKLAVADKWLARAESIEGASAGVKARIAQEKARIAKDREPTEFDSKPYVATPRFKRRDDIRAQIEAAGTNPGKLADLWSHYGFECFKCFDPDGIREARDAIAALKKRPGFYAGWWLNAIRAYDCFAAFPKPEEKIVFPKDLAAFGVEDGRTAIAGEIDWDPEDATACIREAIESGATTIVLEDRGSPWYVQTIRPKSNQRIILKKGVKILMDKVSTQQKSGAPMFNLSGLHNVIIEGEGGPEDVYVGKFSSMAERNANSKDYGGSGVTIAGARNIVVRNITFGANTMDGVTLTGIGADTQNIYLENLVLRDNYRQAMSACNVFGLYCRNVSFLNTFGGDPMCGIDFESEYETEATSEMYFLDCTFADNAGAAVNFSQSSYYPVTALFRRCKFLPGRNHQQITVFARSGVYMGQNVKAPSKIIFDDCDMETPAWTAPVILSNSSLFDVEFKNFRLKEKNRGNRAKGVNAPVRVDLRREYRYSFNWKDWDTANEGSLVFDNFSVEGFDEKQPLEVWDFTGGYDVPNVSGTLVMNGKTIDMSAYAYKAPEKAMGLREIRKFDPADYIPPAKDAKADTPAVIPVSFGFTWKGSWFDTGCDYRAIYAEDGAWKMKKFLPGVTELGLEGRPVAYYCRSAESKAKLIPRKPKEPYTLYFEVPAGEAECTLKLMQGFGALRNPAGEVVHELTPETHGKVSRYLKMKSTSGKAEIWSLTLTSAATIKFFAPLNGIFAESPAALPRRRQKKAMDAFLSYMDKKARDFGMAGTHYASPSGLTQSSRSTPQDGLKLGLAMTASPEAMEIWNTPSRDFSIEGTNSRALSVKNIVISSVEKDLAAYYPFLGGKGGSLTYSDHHRAQILLVEVKGKRVMLSLMALGKANFNNIFKSAKELCDMMADHLDGKTPVEGPNLQALVEGDGGYAACVVPDAKEVDSATPADLLKRPDALSRSPEASRYPASTSKVMTTLCALDFVKDTKAVTVTVAKADISDGSGSKFFVGDTLTLHDALRIMMMESSNTLANAIARTVGEIILAQ